MRGWGWRGRYPFSPVYGGGGGAEKGRQPPGEGWRNVPLSSPAGLGGGQVAEGPAQPNPGEGGEASSGHRGKQERAGREGTSCQGPGLPSFAKEVLPGLDGRGQEVGRRLVQGRGQREAAVGQVGEGAPISPESPTPQPASPSREAAGRPTSASFKVLPFGVELGFLLPRPAPHLPPRGASRTPPLRSGAETPPLPSPNTFQGPRLGTHFCLAFELILWSPPRAGI